jgi:transposase
MQVVTTIGLDIAKSVFEVHGVDAHGRVVVRRQLKRRYVLPFFKKVSPCLVGIEACAAYLQQALAVIRYAKLHGTKHRPWLTAPLARRPTKVAAIALANKIARMAWAMMAKGERYKEPAALAA